RYKTLTFRALPAEQLEAAVKLEMENSTGSQELWRMIGYQIQGQQVTVRVAIISDQQLTESVKLLTQAGLEVSWSGLSSRGIQNFILFHQGLFETETDQSAYLYLSEEQAEYGVVTEDAIDYRREIALGNRALREINRDDVQTDFMDELRLSFASSKTVGQATTPDLWLFGTDENVLANLKKVLLKAGITVILPEKTHLGGVKIQNRVSRLAPLIGLALDELGWNTLDKLRIYSLEQQRRELTQGKINWLVKSAVVGIFLLLGFWWSVQAEVIRNQKEQHWLAAQSNKLAKLQRLEALTQTNLRKIKLFEERSALRGRELEYLLALQRQLPEATVITDLNIEEGQIKNLSGVTPSVSVLLTKLKADPVLRGLKLKGNILTMENGSEGFQLEMKDTQKEPAK
ncbi:MAG TPA: PilN domain-containing protein, partial [Bacillota bacterium]|nr:PilN domain-containing protein [Bacillota bacterium]